MPIFNNALAGAAGSGGAAAGYKIERSLRFNSGDSPYLNKTPSSAGNRGKWTWSGWVKRSKLGAWSVIFSAAGSGSNDYLAFEPSDRLTFDLANTGSGRKLTTRVFRDCSAFYHIVLAVDYTSATASDRIKLYVNGVLETAFDTDSAPAQNHSGNVNNNTEHRISSVPTTGIDFFNGYLADVHFLDGLTPGTSTDDVNGSVTGTPNAVYLTDFGEFDATTGVWNPIRFTGTYGTNGFHLDFSDNSSKDALGIDAAGSNHWTVNNLIAQGPTTATQFKVYGNASNTGSSSATNVSSLTTLQSTNVSTYNSLGTIYNHLTADLGSVGTHAIQARTYLNTGSDILVFASDNGSSWSSISNQQDPYVFTGRYIQWVRTGQGYDNQVLTAVTAAQETDSLLDSPTNYEAASGNNGGNYCTFNPLDINSQATLSNGNLDWSTTNGNGVCRGTIAVSSGKWYWEYTYNQKPSGGGVGFGVLGVSESKDFPGAANAPDGYTYYSEGSSFTKKYGQGSNSNYGADFAVGDVIGVALDLDNGTITFYKNGVSQGQAFSGISGTYAPSISSGTSVGTGKASFNAGQRPFAISSVPTGFKSLCTQNLDDPLIANGSTAFDAVAYSGSGAARSISLGFSPDLVWTKQRNGTSWHYLIDTVRENTKALFSNTTNGDATNNSQMLTAFNSDGYSLGNDTAFNATNNTYIAWAWDAGNLATNSAYNQSDVWSSRCTGTVYSASLGYKNAFDGSTSTASHSANGNTITFTPSTAIPVSSSIKIYYDIGSITGTSGTADITINGTSYVATAHSNRSNGHFTVTNVSSITSMVWERAADNDLIAVKAIEVDGKVLVDKGVIPVGSLNSSSYTQGDVYSDDLSAAYNNEENKGFDGDLTTTAAAGPQAGTITWTPSGGLSYTSSVRAYTTYTNYNNQAAGFSFNGGSTIETATAGWYTLATGSGTITSISHSYAATYRGGFNAIEVDGKILVDSDQTPPNVPSIASTVRANPTAGFSIVNYTGNGTDKATVSHGLNANVALYFLKNRSSAANWAVLGHALNDAYGGSQKYLQLNTTTDAGDAAQGPGNSSTIELHTDSTNNTSGDNYVAYCFAPVEGYSAFGSYTGNGSNDGPFVHTGFRPRWLMIKPTNITESWNIIDAARSPFNQADDYLSANTSNAENSAGAASFFDFTSNGFKVRGSGNYINGSGNTMIYIAFAENPFKTARAR